MPPVVVTYIGFPFQLALLVGVHLLVAILGAGRQEMSLRVSVTPTGPAYEAGLRDGDRVVAMNGTRLASWAELAAVIQDNGDPPIDMEVERGVQVLHFNVPREPSPWPLLFRLGELSSYAWPFSMLIAFVVSRANTGR